MTEKKLNPDSALKPMGMAFAGFSLWAAGDAAVRSLNDHSVFLVTFMSAFFCTAFLCAFSSMLGGFRETFRQPRLKLRLFRALLLSISAALSFFIFSNLELATAYAIVFTAPFLVKIISVILTGEKIKSRSWAITLLGFAGVLVVLRPGWVPLGVAPLAALLDAFLFALGFVLSRYIGEENQTALSMALFQYLFLIAMMAVPAYHAWMRAGIEPFAVILTAFIGLGSALGTILVSRAFMRAPAAYVAPVHYIQMLWGLLFGAVLFGEYPDAWTAVGAGIIILAGLLLVHLSRERP